MRLLHHICMIHHIFALIYVSLYFCLTCITQQLAWYFVPTGNVVDNNDSYDDYDDRLLPTDKSMNDAPDFLRSTDFCYRDGSYSLSNCPKPPDCNFSGKFGPAKLCINRAPRPDDGQFYVLVMKCIPQWENWCVKFLIFYSFFILSLLVTAYTVPLSCSWYRNSTDAVTNVCADTFPRTKAKLPSVPMFRGMQLYQMMIT
jgi:hypothetical protein